MTVVERPRGLLVAGVFEGSPAERAGIRPGDLITAVNGKSIAGKSSDVSTALIKGKPGTYVRADDPQTGRRHARGLRVRRERIRVPAVGRRAAARGRPQGRAWSSWRRSRSGAHGELVTRAATPGARGAQGFVLDLRANGGGLLDEAVLVSSVFVPNGDDRHDRRARTRPRRVFKATGDVATRKPVVVLVDRGTASASEIVTAALHERLGAPVVGRRTFGKGVFGQIFDLSNGGALDLVVGNYYTPYGPQPERQGHPPGRARARRPRDPAATRRSSGRSTCSQSSERARAPEMRRRTPTAAQADVRRGWGSSPSGDASRWSSRSSSGAAGWRSTCARRRDVAVGDWCWCAPSRRGRRGRARRRSCARSGARTSRVTWSRRCSYERGHASRASTRAVRGTEAAARRSGPRSAEPPARPDRRCPRSRSIPQRAATSTTRSRSSATVTGCGCYVHIADVAAFVRPGGALDREAQRRGNSVYVPGAVEPMLPEALSSDACSLVPGVPRSAVTVEISIGAGGRARSASFYRSLIRSDARLTYEQVDRDLRRREQRARRRSPSRCPGARGSPRSCATPRLARGALGVETSEPEFEFDDDGQRGRGARRGPDRGARGDRAADDPRQRAGRPAARAARVPHLYRVHEQPEPAAVELLVAQLESLDVPTPPLPEGQSPTDGRRAGRARSARACWSTSARPAAAAGRSPRSCCAR